MQQNLAKFVMLRFSRELIGPAIPLLLINCGDGSPLQVCIHPGWKQLPDSTDQAFLAALVDEWKALDPLEIPLLFAELERQSRGPIRFSKQGQVTVAECERMIEEVLSTAIYCDE